MTEAEKDDNRNPTMIGVDKGDLDTPELVAVDPDSNSSGLPGVIVEVAA